MPEIAIDTNVFEHLLNNKDDNCPNSDAHIDKLLGALIQSQYRLLVDSTKKIANEYVQLLIPIIKNMDETKPQKPLLLYWMETGNRQQVELDSQDTLMQRIKQVIHEQGESVDRAFVYVACRGNATLVTNDAVHISDRRSELLRNTKKFRGKVTDIQSSKNAAVLFCTAGGQA